GRGDCRRGEVVDGDGAGASVASGTRGCELTTILPAAVFGPPRSAATLGSLQIIAALLNGSAIAIPRLGLELVDVRNVATAHVLAMTNPAAAGQRFIASGDVLWYSEIAEIL